MKIGKYHVYLILSKHKFSEEKIDMLKKGKAHLRRNPIQKPKEDNLVGTSGSSDSSGTPGSSPNLKE